MSIIHWFLSLGRRKSPSPTLHDESRIMHGLFFGPRSRSPRWCHSFAPLSFLVSGVPNMRFSWFFFGTKKARIFVLEDFPPLNWGKLWGVMSSTCRCTWKKGMYWEEIWNLRAYIHMFGWYIKYTYSLYIHVWLIYFYIGSIGRLYIYLHGMVELFGEEN